MQNWQIWTILLKIIAQNGKNNQRINYVLLENHVAAQMPDCCREARPKHLEAALQSTGKSSAWIMASGHREGFRSHCHLVGITGLNLIWAARGSQWRVC